MSKRVSVFRSFHFGLQETLKHWPKLLPMTFGFYVPEFSKIAGLRWFDLPLLSDAYKFVVFFFLISLSLKLTAPAADMGPRRSSPRQFLLAKTIKWSAMGLAFALGLVPAWWWHRHLTGVWPLDVSGPAALWASVGQSLRWIGQRPLWEQGALLGLAALPPYLVFVDWNFFGYALVERNLNAWESLRQARLIAQGAFWELTLFYLGCGALIALGLMLWTVGVLFTFPVTLLATVQVYRELREQTPLP